MLVAHTESLISSLFSHIVWRLFQIKDKREKRKVSVSPDGDVFFATAPPVFSAASRLVTGNSLVFNDINRIT